MSCYFQKSLALLHSAVGWHAVCDCDTPDHTHSLLDIYEYRILGDCLLI